MAEIKDFLNSKSMLTPGVAGAITMLITNTVNQQFDVPHKWTALILSFLLGLLVFSDTTTQLWQRAIFYILNSLIIFAMAVGTNVAGAATLPSVPVDNQFTTEDASESSDAFFRDWFVE